MVIPCRLRMNMIISSSAVKSCLAFHELELATRVRLCSPEACLNSAKAGNGLLA